MTTPSLQTLIFILLASSAYGQFRRRMGDAANPLSIGGAYIDHGDCPWLCPIFKKSPETKYICGSSLVSNQYVVTAAHCVRPKSSSAPVDPSLLYIFAGIYDLVDQSNPNVQYSDVQEVKIHPDWDAGTQRFDADIALLKLTNTVTFNKFVQRIALPGVSYIKNSLSGLVVGYGKSEREEAHEQKPRRIKIPIVDAEECYQNHEIFSYLKSRDAFCAGKNGVIPCNGDSGSSFYILEKSSPILIGVVSAGISTRDGKCIDNVFALFTDVSKFMDWIKKEVGSGYLTGNDNIKNIDNRFWKSNEGFCEYVVDDGYRCTLRGVRSESNDVKITGVSGQHKDNRDDDDVGKIWIIEQDATYIPEMSDVLEKFRRIVDFRIWSCGLKYVERSKLAPFARRLRVLDFFNNNIEDIPEDAFNDLTQLQELKLLNNRIKHLHEKTFQNLHNLKWFFAEFNEIEDLPEHLFDPTQIVVVSMKNNKLTRIYVDFRKLRNVNVIDFNNNVCIDQCLGHYCGKMSVAEMQNQIEQKCR